MTMISPGEGGAVIIGSFFADGENGQPAGTIVRTAGEFEFTQGRYAECTSWDWIDDQGVRRMFHLVVEFRDDVEPGAADISFVYGTAEFPAGDTSLADGDLARMLELVAGWSPTRGTIGDRQFSDLYINTAIGYSGVASDVYQPAPGVITWELRSGPTGL
jgi:hypothetical protein